MKLVRSKFALNKFPFSSKQVGPPTVSTRITHFVRVEMDGLGRDCFGPEVRPNLSTKAEQQTSPDLPGRMPGIEPPSER